MDDYKDQKENQNNQLEHKIEEAEEFEEEPREEGHDEYSNEDVAEKEPSKVKRLSFVFWILFLILLIGGIFGGLIYKTSFTFSKIRVDNNKSNDLALLPLNKLLPEDDKDREDILLLGYRADDDPNGGLLTDTMMVVSIKKSTHQVAMISIPRDIFMKVPGTEIYEKINYAHAYGFMHGGSAQGLLYAKIAVSQVTGLHIDSAVLVNFNAFEELVNALGGVDVYLEKPFKENEQFSKEMIVDLPAGENHLDGLSALYFVRSRYTTSDFDRARRQQQVILAIKDKALSLGVLTNPVKIFNLFDALGKNVRTDMTNSQISTLVSEYPNIDFSHVKQKVFDTSPEGLLYSSYSEAGAYILLPVGGSFAKIQQTCKNIFN